MSVELLSFEAKLDDDELLATISNSLFGDPAVLDPAVFFVDTVQEGTDATSGEVTLTVVVRQK